MCSECMHLLKYMLFQYAVNILYQNPKILMDYECTHSWDMHKSFMHCMVVQ